MSSVNTNVGALLAQKFLRSTSAEMNVTQNRVSSGLRVSTVTDDASTFAVASGVRGDIKAKLIQLSDESLSTASRSTYNTDLTSMVAEVNNYLSQASYNGRNLLGSGGANMVVVGNIDGSALTVRNNDVSDLAFAGTISSNTTATAALSTLTVFKGNLDTALANLGSDLTRVESQTEFVKQQEETVKIGLGALVDADLAKESATLTSLQVRQQLGIQAVGIANQAPQALLGLFR